MEDLAERNKYLEQLVVELEARVAELEGTLKLAQKIIALEEEK